MRDRSELLDQLSGFEDSKELSATLHKIYRAMRDDDPGTAYWIKESACHIDSLWKLAVKLGDELKISAA